MCNFAAERDCVTITIFFVEIPPKEQPVIREGDENSGDLCALFQPKGTIEEILVNLTQ